MNQSAPHSRPVVVLACQVFEHWLENYLSRIPGWNNQITFFDYGLHKVPKNLRLTIQNAIDSIDQPSMILLGYGLCGNGLNKINSGKHFLLIPRTDDCIAVLLGSYDAYRQEMNKEPGTYYLSKGWLEGGSNPLLEFLDLVKKYGPDKASWLMDYQYHNYRRLMLVARNSEELAFYRPKALEVAEYCQRFGMRYEEIIGKDEFFDHLSEIARDFENLGENFLLIPPGGTLTQDLFIRE